MMFGTLYKPSLKLERLLERKVDIVTNPPEHMRPADLATPSISSMRL